MQTLGQYGTIRSSFGLVPGAENILSQNLRYTSVAMQAHFTSVANFVRIICSSTDLYANIEAKSLQARASKPQPFAGEVHILKYSSKG